MGFQVLQHFLASWRNPIFTVLTLLTSSQAYIEQKLQAALQVITASPDLRRECSRYAIKAICLSTLPLCDMQTSYPKPRKVSRTEPISRVGYFQFQES